MPSGRPAARLESHQLRRADEFALSAQPAQPIQFVAGRRQRRPLERCASCRNWVRAKGLGGLCVTPSSIFICLDCRATKGYNSVAFAGSLLGVGNAWRLGTAESRPAGANLRARPRSRCLPGGLRTAGFGQRFAASRTRRRTVEQQATWELESGCECCATRLISGRSASTLVRGSMVGLGAGCRVSAYWSTFCLWPVSFGSSSWIDHVLWLGLAGDRDDLGRQRAVFGLARRTARHRRPRPRPATTCFAVLWGNT